MRTLSKKSEKAASLVAEYKALVLDINKQVDEIEKHEKERNKIALKVQKIKDKLNPITEKLIEGELGDFEVVTNVKLSSEEGMVDIEIVDQVEQFKEAYLKRTKKG